MGEQQPVRIIDLWDVRIRVGTVRFGVWTTIALCTSGVIYCLLSWDRPNRRVMVILLAAALATSLVITLLDAEAIVRSRWREYFFLSWSLIDIAFIATLVALDGGAKSAFAGVYFLPLVFAALSYPLPLVWPICLLDVAAALIVGAVVGNPDWMYLGFFSAVLGCTGLLCVWHARDNEKQRRDLARISRTDSLTDSLNRRGFEERLDAELGESGRAGRALTLLLIDLDDFKRVNDTLGHAAGDELLCWVVTTVRAALRPIDAIGRLGGDEFAVLLPGAARADALEVAARIRDSLAERIAATMGLATFPLDGADREELHQRADAELYAAKHGSKLIPGPIARDLGWAATLAQTVDRRATPPEDHSSEVARHATGIARRMRWDGEELSLLGIAGMLHDVGKVSLPDRILRGPDPLTHEERDQHIRAHPLVGAELVSRVDGLGPAVAWIRHSHENWDGSGYPDGLRGEAIPLGSRILHVADAYASMTGRRSYRDSLSAEAALEELHELAGIHFDPACVDALAAHLSGSAEEAA
ncbi:MAG TPA: HD domain-containing phosphohydrolase [Thermoleophilaceae bacterium]|jgi:diguanylate cyclase (GGDEF)-like protein